MSEKYLIVGLGNPGKDYEKTRHNLGFLVLKYFAKQKKLKFSASPLIKGWVAQMRVKGNWVYLLLPSTYMNNSGMAVKRMANTKKVAFENILVVGDDMNLEFGQLRIRKKGGDGGHNGLDSIIRCIGTKEFGRLRLGIGAPRRKDDATDFVLGEFKRSEQKHLDEFIEKAYDCCWVWITQGMNKAMNQFNRRKDDE